VYWCFHCYTVNEHADGLCHACGQPVKAPGDLTYTDGLTWALRHPDGDRAVLAAKTLGSLRAREAVSALRAAAEAGRDIYLREAALRSLLKIEGAVSLGHWLVELSRSAPFNVREVARQALEEAGDASADGAETG